MPVSFRHSPLQEAVVEMIFEGSQPWDWTVPGLMYDRIKGSYPKKQQLNVLQLEIQPSEGKIQQALKGGVARLQFLKDDGTASVQVGENLLAVTHARPYPGWERFRAMILENFQTYRSVAQPIGLKRIGVRYVNRIEIPGGPIQLSDYFTSPPTPPRPISDNIRSFLQQILVSYEDPIMLQRLTLGSVDSPSGPSAVPTFVLDIDVYGESPAVPSLEALEAWMTAAHQRMEAGFFGSLTERTRIQILGEERYEE